MDLMHIDPKFQIIGLFDLRADSTIRVNVINRQSGGALETTKRWLPLRSIVVLIGRYF